MSETATALEAAPAAAAKPKAYFAHSTSDFDTAFEKQCVAWLEETYEVINPNCEEGRWAYQTGGMKWFFEAADKCDVCVFLPLPDGSTGSGVAVGVEKFFKRGAPVFRIDVVDGALLLNTAADVGFKLNSVLTKEATMRYSARENGGRS
jgi:hypothetical protein